MGLMYETHKRYRSLSCGPWVVWEGKNQSVGRMVVVVGVPRIDFSPYLSA